jgi:hypothetical protein
MLTREQLQELKARLDAIGKDHKKASGDRVHDLHNDFKLILDMRDSPEKTALEERFLKGLLYAESLFLNEAK